MRSRSLALALLLGLAAAAWGQDGSRGQSLHDTHCLMCHDSRVYTRSDRSANNRDQVRAEVQRWQKAVALNWAEADVDAVTDFIAARYYRLDCTTSC